MATKDQIKAALAKLDPTNPEHWTDDGLPITRVVQMFADDATIKRSDINDADPLFTRDSVTQPATQATFEDEPAETVAGSNVPAEAPAPVVKPKVDSNGFAVNSQVVEGQDGQSAEEWKAELQLAAANAQATLDEARVQLRAAQDAEKKAVKVLDAATDKLQRAFPPLTHSENIQQYIASENQKRAAKFGAHGIYATSNLDAALSGRRGRGFGNGTMRGKTDPRFVQQKA